MLEDESSIRGFIVINLTRAGYEVIEKHLHDGIFHLGQLDPLPIFRQRPVPGGDYFGELKIVDVNIRRLRLKIEDNAQNPTYINTVWGYGYGHNFPGRINKLQLHNIPLRKLNGEAVGILIKLPEISHRVAGKILAGMGGAGFQPIEHHIIIVICHHNAEGPRDQERHDKDLLLDDQVVGAMRYVTSMSGVSKELLITVGVALGLLILGVGMVYVR